MPAHSIRVAVLGDAMAISALSAQLGYPVDSRTIRERLGHILSREDSCVFVAVNDDLSLGWIHARTQQLVESPLRVEIGGLVVDENRFRQGIGRQLIAAVESWAIEKGAEELSVRCNTKRVDAHLFYKALEFEQVKTQITFRKPLGGPG